MSKVSIGEVSSIIRGVSYKKEQAQKEADDNSLFLVRANNISNGTFNNEDCVYIPRNLVSRDQYVCAGDIVITMSSGSKAHVGKVALAKKDMDCTFGAFCAKIVPTRIDPAYLFYILQSPDFRQYIEKQCKGTNINNLKQSYIYNYIIELPALDEQRRIVSRIEELFSQLDASVATMRKVKEQLGVYRQAVLKEAFDGAFISDVSEKNRAMRIDEFANVDTGSTPLTTNKAYYNGQIAWVASGKVNDGLIYSPTSYITDLAIRDTNCKIFPAGTLVVAMYGEGKTRGKCAELMIPAATNQALAAITLKEDSPVDKMFLKWYLEYNYQMIRRKASGGVQPNLNLGIIKAITVNVSSKEAQRETVVQIEMRLSICESIEQTVDAVLQQAEAMKQSILKQAFKEDLK